MNNYAPFQMGDLDELAMLFARANAVVAMEDAAAGFTDDSMIVLRHDVDNAIEPAVAMAQWEGERSYRASYYFLHTSSYWRHTDTFQAALEVIAECGHEIGFHINAIAEAIRTGRDPLEIAAEAVAELRSYGHEVHGVVPHGDPFCHLHRFVNDELFIESPRPKYGAPDRYIAGVKLNPVPRSLLGFDYDPNWLPRAVGVSDSGGHWSQPFEQLAAGFPYEGQTHVLIHPDWWSEAFSKVAA
jgi:hypothetical protein